AMAVHSGIVFRLPSLSNLDHVIDAALKVDGARAGIVFHYCGPDEPFVIAGYSKVPDIFFVHEAEIRPGDGSASGEAVTHRHRVVIRDVLADPIAGPHRVAAETA